MLSLSNKTFQISLNLMAMEITHPFSTPYTPLWLEMLVTALLLSYPHVCTSESW